MCFVNVQSSLHENYVFSVCACMGNAAYFLHIMRNSISGLDNWHNFRFDIAVFWLCQIENLQHWGIIICCPVFAFFKEPEKQIHISTCKKPKIAFFNPLKSDSFSFVFCLLLKVFQLFLKSYKIYAPKRISAFGFSFGFLGINKFSVICIHTIINQICLLAMVFVYVLL